MSELEKMHRVLGKEIEGAPHNTWLVLDANTGQNGLSQAELFNEITDLNGIILTKMDGTSKGGIIIAIKNMTGLPVILQLAKEWKISRILILICIWIQ